VLQDGCGLGRSRQPNETPALAEERERLLGHDPEPLPAIGSIGVGVGGCLQIPAGLGDRGVRRDERVLGQRVTGFETGDEPLDELWFPDRATDWIREAVLTESPERNPSPEAALTPRRPAPRQC